MTLVPSSEYWASSGVLTSTLPIFEASGQVLGALVKWGGVSPTAVVIPIWAEVQAARPSAWEGLTAIPAGRVTMASRRAAVARLARSVFWGWWRSTSRPEGGSVRLVVAWAERVGSNSRALQPDTSVGLPPGSVRRAPALLKMPGWTQLSA